MQTFRGMCQNRRAIAALPELEPENASWRGRVGCIFEDDIYLAKDFNAAFSGLMGDLQREPGGWDIVRFTRADGPNPAITRHSFAGLRHSLA